jgi:hypothetical protein
MDPTKPRVRNFVLILLTAILIAAVLRHVLLVHPVSFRSEILVGSMAVAFSAALLTLLVRQRQRRR